MHPYWSFSASVAVLVVTSIIVATARELLATGDGRRWVALGVLGVGGGALGLAAVTAPLDSGPVPVSSMFTAISGAFLAISAATLLASQSGDDEVRRGQSREPSGRISVFGLAVIGSTLYVLSMIGVQPVVLFSAMTVAAVFAASVALWLAQALLRARKADGESDAD